MDNNQLRLQTDMLEEMKRIEKAIQQFREVYTNVKKHELEDEVKGFTIVDQVGTKDAIMAIKEYETAFVGDIQMSTAINNAKQLGMRYRQLEIQLRGGSVIFEGGQFMYSTGELEQGKIDISPREVFRGTIRKLSGETFFRPSLSGTGTVVLDGSFNFLHLFPINTKSRIVLEKGIYLASIGEFEFRTTKNMKAGYIFLSDKALLQTDVRGHGVIALELPVPMNTLIEYEVTPTKPFRVDGSYVLMWSGNLKKNVVPAHGILGSLTSGTGLVEEYTGTGKVWVAPMLDYYNLLRENKEMVVEQEVEEKEEEASIEQQNFFTGFLQRFFR